MNTDDLETSVAIEATANVDEVDDEEVLKASNLDIVGALNNLDLDEDFSIPVDSSDRDDPTAAGTAGTAGTVTTKNEQQTAVESSSSFHFTQSVPPPPPPHQMYSSHHMPPNQPGQFNAFGTNVTPNPNTWSPLNGTSGVYPPEVGINIQHLKLDPPATTTEPDAKDASNLENKQSDNDTTSTSKSNNKLQSPSTDNYLGGFPPFVNQRVPHSQFLNDGGGAFFGDNSHSNYMNGPAGQIHHHGYPVPPFGTAAATDANGKSSNYPMGGPPLWQRPMAQLNHSMLSNSGSNDSRGNINAGPESAMGGNINNSNHTNNNHSNYGGRFNRSHYDGSNNNTSNNYSNHHHNNNHHGGIRRNDLNSHRKMNNRRKGDDASKYVNARLEDFTGEIYSLCKDQHGCRFLQRQLDLGNELEQAGVNNSDINGQVSTTKEVAATMIFNEIYLRIIELMVDPFGNYLIQKLFENISTAQRTILVKNASPEFIRIALDPHGTRALQKLVECIDTKEESMLIIESLSPHIVTLSRDLNGNHVVQKCLQKLTPEDNQFIFETASMHCNEIATHRHGCCVLQRCLDHGNADQREQLSLKVAENATSLSLDPFGNYVVQYVLSRGDGASISIILDHIRANAIKLLLHKFGSNVIEKSLRINKLTESLISVLLENSDKFSDLLNDAYGNYVLQTSLDVANGRDLAKLANVLQPLLVNIKNTPHGRRILTKIQNVC
ncbi:uncharacterized protein KQ657_000300 [Scheffersomyces spartinae]|uniref:PUM-HD domain-containing protein n=1 Tax=Scheffersomyces spartinae TaxID=45513 RepID=A0A9P7VDQ3_9ASCO|nr:uncharacterized protein KQ657_000300 [Scheffersomyces spartinae]KAG7196285.1 hypothetical protein KQ657_000300 [Scheffersomyces spartinae]